MTEQDLSKEQSTPSTTHDQEKAEFFRNWKSLPGERRMQTAMRVNWLWQTIQSAKAIKQGETQQSDPPLKEPTTADQTEE